jgi:hypothetical protein
VDRHDDPVPPATRRILVVILRDERGDRPRELVGERRAVGRGCEADLAVDGNVATVRLVRAEPVINSPTSRTS